MQRKRISSNQELYWDLARSRYTKHRHDRQKLSIYNLSRLHSYTLGTLSEIQIASAMHVYKVLSTVVQCTHNQFGPELGSPAKEAVGTNDFIR